MTGKNTNTKNIKKIMKSFKLKYRSKLFIYFFVVFFIFSSAILFFLYQREKSCKIDKLDSTLNFYADQIDNYIINESIYFNNSYSKKINPFLNIISKDELRVSVINLSGEVLFDSYIKDSKKMDNHLLRDEIKIALKEEFGSNIRKSATTGDFYYYYAKVVAGAL